MIPADTQRLWHAWRQRADQQAFADLVRPEVRYAADLARRAGATAAEADDVVQDALVKLARETSDAPVEVGLRAWICRRVVLGVKMHVRSSVRRRKHERRAPPGPRHASDAPDARLEARDQVEAALATLEEPERRAIVLRFLHDLEYREMAYILGISQNACRIRVHRAVKRLRTLVGERAAAMVAMLVIPPVLKEGTLIAGATTGLGAGTATAIGAGASAGSGAAAAGTGATAAGAVVGTKAVVTTGTGLVAAAAIVAVVVATGTDEKPPPPAPPPVVAKAPAPEPRPEVADPAPPPPPPRVKPSAIAFLDDHFSGAKDGTAVMQSVESIRRVIGSPQGGTVEVATTGPVTDLDLEGLARRYDRIVLDAGVFRVTRPLQAWADRGVLEIVGRGRDVTFLLSPVRDVVRVLKDHDFAGLIVRDLTFDGDLPNDRRGALLLGIRGTGAGLFERVHFRSWISQAGHGAPVGVTGRALLAFGDCWFTGGVRRRPTDRVLSVRGSVLYRFEDCRFSDVQQVVAHVLRPSPGPRSLGIFARCVFDDAPLVDPRWADGGMPPAYPILVQGGTLRMGWKEDARGDRLERWRARGATSVTGLTVEDEAPRCTLGDLRRVLDAYEPPRGRRVVQVEVYTWYGCDDPAYGMFLADGRGGIEARLVHLHGDEVAEGYAGGFVLDARLPFDPGHGTTLREMLAKHARDLDLDRPVGRLQLTHDTGGNPLMNVVSRLGRRLGVYR